MCYAHFLLYLSSFICLFNVMSDLFRCGHVALIGRPNVGKSTLLNSLLGQKLSITSRRPQTTRHRVVGIKTLANAQIIYVDTPGLHRHAPRAMNRYLNRAAGAAITDLTAGVGATLAHSVA